MKKLTKIKLINWHIFHDETISIKQNVLITGKNGSGKSTLIDAIHFLISGGNAQFNTAANAKTKRTVETYMRGKVGAEGLEFIRGGANVISHVALEFYDNEEKTHFVLGAVLEIRDNSTRSYRTFYHILDSVIQDDFYYDYENQKKQIVNYKNLSNTIEAKGMKINKLDGNAKEVRNKISQVLKLENKKYYELLPKAMVFNPIDDVNKFVYEFLLPEENVNVERIKSDIQTYRDIAKEIVRDEEKLVCLKEISNISDELNSNRNDVVFFDALRVKKNLDQRNKEMKNETKRNEGIVEKIRLIDETIRENKKTRDNLVQQITDIKSSDAYKRVKDLDEEIKRIENDIISLKNEVDKSNKYISDEQILATNLDLEFNLRRFLSDNNFQSFKELLIDYDSALTNKQNELTKRKIELDNLAKEKLFKINELKDEKINLEKGISKYPYNLSRLIQTIETSAKESFLENVEVLPLCELVEVLDDSWRSALEGYLNTRRFDIFVHPKYYDFSLNIYSKFKKEYGFHSIGLVNTSKLKDYELDINSLASKIEVKDENAKKYVNMLMGKLICVDSLDDLKKHEASITKSVMVYKNKASRQTKSDIWEKPYLGNGAKKIRYNSIVEQIPILEEELENTDKEIGIVEPLLRNIKSSKIAIMLEFSNVWEKCENKNDELKFKTEEKASMMNSNLITIEENIKKYERRIVAVEEELDKNDKEKSALNRDLGTSDNERDKLDGVIKELNAEFETLKNDELFNDVMFKEFIEVNSAINIKDINLKVQEIKKKIEKSAGTLVSKITIYVQKYNFDAIPQLEYMNLFIDELNRIETRELVQYKEKAAEALIECNKSFEEDFISKIRNKIRAEKSNIDKLNRVLETKPFGTDEEIYYFTISKSKEKEFADYYDIFDSDQDYKLSELFSEQLSDKNLQLLKDLLNKLTKENTSSEQEKSLQQYTDYRRFMSYDIKITNKYNEVIFFSKTNKEKSGGETQTPFYVIIAASFEQLIKSTYSSKSVACLVILDEAFNNMDESRIEAMMDYYRQLQIQLLIAVPPLRASTISPYVDTTIGLAKSKNRVIVIPQYTV